MIFDRKTEKKVKQADQKVKGKAFEEVPGLYSMCLLVDIMLYNCIWVQFHSPLWTKQMEAI